MAEEYSAKSIKEVREKFNVVEISRKIKKKGDILIISKEMKIKPRALGMALDEVRILSIFPKLEKSKTGILARLRTNRELNLFAKKYDIYNISARNLIKLVREWNKEIQKKPLLVVSQEEHDLIIGSLLGDASIRQREKNSCFRFTHSIDQKSYSLIKKEKLSNFNISEFREVKRKIRNHFIHAMDFATKTHAVFNYYRNLFYKNGRKIITKEILDQITPMALAYWVCDDGSYNNKQGYIVLCTNSYSLEEHNLMNRFFNEKFGLNPTIGFRDGKYFYLRFKKEDSQKLINIIKPFIPEGMGYKIGGIKNVN